MSTTMLIHTSLFFIYLRSMFAIQCPSCEEISFDATDLSISQFYCNLTDISSSACRSELFVDLVDPYPALIRYITAPANVLITNSGESELLTTINIQMDTQYQYGSVVYNCYDKDLCNNNSVVQNQYERLRELNYTQLETNLIELLYDNRDVLKEGGIECYNQQNKIGTCPMNWYCQATLIIEQGRSDSLTTTCVPDRRPGSRAGLIIQSKSVGNDYKKTSISYTCNKNRCNVPAIVQQVREILVKIDLVDSKAHNLNFLSIFLGIICIIIHI